MQVVARAGGHEVVAQQSLTTPPLPSMHRNAGLAALLAYLRIKRIWLVRLSTTKCVGVLLQLRIGRSTLLRSSLVLCHLLLRQPFETISLSFFLLPLTSPLRLPSFVPLCRFGDFAMTFNATAQRLLHAPALDTPPGVERHMSTRSPEQIGVYFCAVLVAVVPGILLCLRMYVKLRIYRRTDVTDCLQPPFLARSCFC